MVMEGLRALFAFFEAWGAHRARRQLEMLHGSKWLQEKLK